MRVEQAMAYVHNLALRDDAVPRRPPAQARRRRPQSPRGAAPADIIDHALRKDNETRRASNSTPSWRTASATGLPGTTLALRAPRRGQADISQHAANGGMTAGNGLWRWAGLAEGTGGQGGPAPRQPDPREQVLARRAGPLQQRDVRVVRELRGPPVVHQEAQGRQPDLQEGGRPVREVVPPGRAGPRRAAPDEARAHAEEAAEAQVPLGADGGRALGRGAAEAPGRRTARGTSGAEEQYSPGIDSPSGERERERERGDEAAAGSHPASPRAPCGGDPNRGDGEQRAVEEDVVEQQQRRRGAGADLPGERGGVERVAEPRAEGVEEGVRRRRHPPGAAGGDGAGRRREELLRGDEERRHLEGRGGAEARRGGVVRLAPPEERAEEQRGVRPQRRHRVVRRRSPVRLHHAQERAVHVVLLEEPDEGVLVDVVRGGGDDEEEAEGERAHGEGGVRAAGRGARGEGREAEGR